MKRAWPLVLLGALIATTASAQPQRYRPDERILITSFDAIAALASDSRRIWTASDAGIGIFDFGAGQWLPPLAPLPGWPIGDSPSALAHDPFGDRLWLGAIELGGGTLHWLALLYAASGSLMISRMRIPKF